MLRIRQSPKKPLPENPVEKGWGGENQEIDIRGKLKEVTKLQGPTARLKKEPTLPAKFSVNLPTARTKKYGWEKKKKKKPEDQADLGKLTTGSGG